MSIYYNKIEVTVDLEKLKRNFTFLQAASGNAIPVIKSDAYGHGLERVAQAMVEAGAFTMAVGTVDEAVRLRRAPFAGTIISLLGPQDATDFKALSEHDILPFIGHAAQLDELIRCDSKAPLSLALKFDTGMARLGFSQDDVPMLLQTLQSTDKVRAVMACSHLATADEIDQKAYVLEQGAYFEAILSDLRAGGLNDLTASLANSAALLAYPDLHFEMQRPGIALYGANPFWGTHWQSKGSGLAPAMDVTAPVFQVRDLPKGKSIHYGRTFVAPHDMRVAIIGVGYADAYSRGLSSDTSPDNRSQFGPASMLIHGTRAPIVGRVCMQMTAIDITHAPEVLPGDRVYLLGGPGENSILPEELAAWWGTITYEVFCLLGLNPKKYS